MRSHAKASSAGSTLGQGESQGSFVRGAEAARGSFSNVDGSGAPSRRRSRIGLSLFAALLVLALLAASALASKDVTTYFGNVSGSGAKGGEFNGPRDSAVNASGLGPANAGDVYVADEANNRIERLSSTGAFISAWGANTTHRDEVQKLVLDATSGTYTLSFEGDTTDPITLSASEGAVDNALDALPSIGADENVNVTGAGFGVNQTFTITFTGALSGANVGQMTVDTSSLEGTAEVSTTENGSGGGGSDYEICTLASKCGQAVASGGNTTAAGNGSFSAPQSIAVDEDTGNVYVSDRGNRRVDEYDGEGNFVRSFGWDVAESGPGDTGTEYEICNQADGDVCKVGVEGSGVGQYGAGSTLGFGIAVSPPDGNASVGSVFLADSGNRRVDTFNLDGTSPASFGSSSNFGSEQPRAIAVDSRGIVYASDSNNGGDIQRYDSLNANGGGVGFLAPILPPNDEAQKITFTGFATGNLYRLTCPNGTPTVELAYVTGENGRKVIQQGLEEACGGGAVSAEGNPPNTTVTFVGALGGANQAPMTCAKLSGAGSCSVSTTTDGNPGPLRRGSTAGLAVDPDSDGGGSDADFLHVLRDPAKGGTVVQQFGPVHAPGLTAAPTAVDDTHGSEAGLTDVQGLGLNSANGNLYVSATNEVGGLDTGHRLYVLGEGSSLSAPGVSIGFPTHTERSATFTGSVDPNGALASCKFQYSTDEVNWTDIGGARGTGELHAGEFSSKQVTSVTTTEGAFTVGQTITSSDGGIPINTKIIQVIAAENVLVLSQEATTKGPVTLTAVGASPCAGLTPDGGSQPVSQAVSGLVPNTKYFVRLQASRPFFPILPPVNSIVRSFTTDPTAPLVTNASAKAIDDSSVRVSATIDPAHSPTVYVIQYGTTPALGSSSSPVSIGEGSSPLEVSTIVDGLKASTTYYFKMVATNLTGPTGSASLKATTFTSRPSFGPCPNDQFRTGPSAHLPDCRAYEQATPTDKYGSDVGGHRYGVEASTSGDGITFFTLSGFPGAEGFQVPAGVFLARRGADSWSTRGLLPPPSLGDNAGVQAWTPDLELSFIRATIAATATEKAKTALLMRDSSDGSFTTVLPYGQAVAEKSVSENFGLAGAFDDDSKIVFETKGPAPVSFGPVPDPSKFNLYLYDRETGDLTLAGLLPDSECSAPPCAPAGGSRVASAFGATAITGEALDQHVVSSAGDVYLTDNGTGQLYLRHEAASPGASTVPVSASEASSPDPSGTFVPTFWGATPDGSHAFFSSEQELTDGASTAPGAQDLYRFDSDAPEGSRLTDLAPGADVRGVLGFSDDGSYIYFAANADLDGTGPARDGDCQKLSNNFQGQCSLYVDHGGEITFVARLDITSGVGLVGDVSAGVNTDIANWLSTNFNVSDVKTARVSPDGETLLFRSQRSPTGYDNFGSQCTLPSGGYCAEFYRYEVASGVLSCVSCSPTGVAPTGRPALKNGDLYRGSGAHVSFAIEPFLSRNLSPDGKRVFFQTADKLVPEDVNGDQSCPYYHYDLGVDFACTDVYEWEAPGKGTCTTQSSAYSPANDGCIYLLSTGTGAYPSYLADVSESSDAAFIYSRQQLVPADQDSQEDIYAVRVDGGLASQHAVVPPTCEGDACRGASSTAPSVTGAGSAVFEGPGNPKADTNETRCPKGKREVHAKGRTRCVARRHKSKQHRHKRHHRRANDDRRASR